MSVKRRRHSPAQIVEKVREADRLLNAGQSLGQVLQHLEVPARRDHRALRRIAPLHAILVPEAV